MNTCDVLFYVQHLLGIGHLRRTVTLARAMSAHGLRVIVASGGDPLPGLALGGVELVQLPPAQARDQSFKVLLDERGAPVDEQWRARRRGRLLGLFDRVQPRVLMLELFPFGRQQFRFELIPLLERAQAARPRPWVVSSVRDILVQPREEKAQRALAIARRFIDQVLVHGDERLIAFDRTFPLASHIADKIRYTGYVMELPDGRPPSPGGTGGREVLVSAGGGAVGLTLLQAALCARPSTPLADRPWRLLMGPKMDERAADAIRGQAPQGVVVERFRNDFPLLLEGAALSISQGGYNTVMDVLRAGVPSVVVPYAGREETEQTLRAEILSERGALVMLPEHQLRPATLAKAAQDALRSLRRGPLPFRTDGSQVTAALMRELVRRPWQPGGN